MLMLQQQCSNAQNHNNNLICKCQSDEGHVLSGARTGIMAPGYFFNSTLAAPYVNKRGQWLNAPEAVLYGISGGQYRNILVSLDSPVYDEATQVPPQLNSLFLTLQTLISQGGIEANSASDLWDLEI